MTSAWTDAEWRYHYDERAAICEYDGGMTREAAETHARSIVIREMVQAEGLTRAKASARLNAILQQVSE